jgi:hypothetical protein
MFTATHPLTPPTPSARAASATQRAWLAELPVQSRRIRVADDDLAGALAEVALPLLTAPLVLGTIGSLHVIEPFSREPRSSSWAGRARLVGRGPRLVRSARVHLTVGVHADGVHELWLRPVARSPHHWGVRRLRRHIALARLAADELERRIQAAARPPVRPEIEAHLAARQALEVLRAA